MGPHMVLKKMNRRSPCLKDISSIYLRSCLIVTIPRTAKGLIWLMAVIDSDDLRVTKWQKTFSVTLHNTEIKTKPN